MTVVIVNAQGEVMRSSSKWKGLTEDKAKKVCRSLQAFYDNFHPDRAWRPVIQELQKQEKKFNVYDKNGHWVGEYEEKYLTNFNDDYSYVEAK